MIEALKVPLTSSWAFRKVLPVLLCCWQPFRGFGKPGWMEEMDACKWAKGWILFFVVVILWAWKILLGIQVLRCFKCEAWKTQCFPHEILSGFEVTDCNVKKGCLDFKPEPCKGKRSYSTLQLMGDQSTSVVYKDIQDGIHNKPIPKSVCCVRFGFAYPPPPPSIDDHPKEAQTFRHWGILNTITTVVHFGGRGGWAATPKDS